MAAPDEPHRDQDPRPGKRAEGPPGHPNDLPGRTPAGNADSHESPQWGEAYQLFDGEFVSLDELLRTSGER